MKSTEKVYAALEELADAEDGDIAEAFPFPVPPALLRGILPAIAKSIPSDPAELDAFLTNVGEFCHSFRSDGYVPA